MGWLLIILITFAGFPPINTSLPKLLVTTLPAATTTLLPNITPGHIIERPPIQQLSPIVTGLPYSTNVLRSSASRG